MSRDAARLLDPSETANDHPDRCRIDRIELAGVIEAAESLLARHA